MRVTQSMLNNQMLQNLRTSNERMQKYQDMLSTGKRINKPADDPVGVSFAMRYKAQLGRNEQYQRSLSSANSMLEANDSALFKINEVLQRARTLAVQGASDTIPADARKSIAKEIEQLKQELVSLGNTQFNGKYIFNGQITDKAPYTQGNPELDNADNRNITIGVADGVTINTNISGIDVFGSSSEQDNAFAVLEQLKNALNNDQSLQVSQTIGYLDARMNKIQNNWAEVGARTNRVELIQSRLKDQEVNLNKLLSETEDADYTEVITDLKMAETVQRAALSAGARIIQPALVDFLR